MHHREALTEFYPLRVSPSLGARGAAAMPFMCIDWTVFGAMQYTMFLSSICRNPQNHDLGYMKPGYMDISYTHQPKSREFYQWFCGFHAGILITAACEIAVNPYVENGPCERVQEHEGSYHLPVTQQGTMFL